jgi:uncharacterized protein (DUF39 family)
MYLYYSGNNEYFHVTDDADNEIVTIMHNLPFDAGMMTYANDTDGLHNYLIHIGKAASTDILCHIY